MQDFEESDLNTNVEQAGIYQYMYIFDLTLKKKSTFTQSVVKKIILIIFYELYFR